MIWIQEPEVGSQSRMALSHPELASRLPSGLHPTPDTLQRWPRNTLGSVPPPLPATSQRVTRVSAPALASRVPSGLQSGSRRRSEEHTSELQSHVNLVCR